MDTLLYLIARAVVGLIQALPLRCVARLGRLGGMIAYGLDRRHRRVAVENLARCFGRELSPRQIKRLARENFRRIGENFACAAKTAAMTFEELRPHLEFSDPFRVLEHLRQSPPRGVVGAIGHFGNFELYSRLADFAPHFKCATTYRGLRQPRLDRLLKSLRERSGCRFFERRFEAAALKAFMNQPGVMLGLLADQHAGPHGLRLPFLGQDCSTSPAPALFALRYHCRLYTAICYRVGLARWRIEAGPEIPTTCEDKPRPLADIMRDVNQAFEVAVRRDPANWFWVHNRWKLGAAAPANTQNTESSAAPHATVSAAGP
ncbi:MAG TPA: hypothetical protein PKX23_09925 [Verrucomicrobiota bacterium]|nr:hypothetical protein [Verrucomicrobiota bacterium]HRT07971.1 hypothetical protein [Candidatus Paceibacterota bacterium]HRT57185.1 hypothetical protein [Candidatus Paceibacterota bacterium]